MPGLRRIIFLHFLDTFVADWLRFAKTELRWLFEFRTCGLTSSRKMLWTSPLYDS